MDIFSADSLDVMCGFDDNYAAPFAAMVMSLREFSVASCRLNFVLVAAFLTAPIRQLLEQFLGGIANTTLRWLNIDTARIANAPLSLHFTSAAYARLLAFDAINHCGRLLYSDCDLVCQADIGALWAEPLQGTVLGAVLDPNATFRFDGHTEALGLKSGAIHFNSGVMFVDLEMWKQQELTKKCLQFIDERRSSIRWADQDVLNANVGTWLRVPSHWNAQTHFYKPRLIRHLEKHFPTDLAAAQTPRIVHFNDPQKPWHQGYQHPLQNAYYHFLGKSGWTELVSVNREPVQWHVES